MPKTRRDRSVSFESPRKSSVSCSSSVTCESKAKNPPSEEDLKEWEDARCPVCIEHPHNAVLLVCSAYDKGCRPYMCDTSYRHSNCLDQFCKSFVEDTKETPLEEGAEPPLQPSDIVTSQEEEKPQSPVATEIATLASMHKFEQKLVCPLCRGLISGWVVVDSARDFMNDKTRICACETCEFNGNYCDLRKHARLDHPQVRPSEADPERQRSWRRLERQRDIGDVLSTIQSTFGDDEVDDLPMDERGWITIFLFFRVWQPRRRSRGQPGLRRRSSRHWGEAHDAERASASASIEHDTDDEAVTVRRRVHDTDDEAVTVRRRVRRRLSTPDDEEV